MKYTQKQLEKLMTRQGQMIESLKKELHGLNLDYLNEILEIERELTLLENQ